MPPCPKPPCAKPLKSFSQPPKSNTFKKKGGKKKHDGIDDMTERQLAGRITVEVINATTKETTVLTEDMLNGLSADEAASALKAHFGDKAHVFVQEGDDARKECLGVFSADQK